MIESFFPNYCIGCGRVIGCKGFLCEECSKKIRGPIIGGEKIPNISRISFLWKYETPMKEIIKEYKFNKRYRVSNFFVCKLKVLYEILDLKNKIIIPVPTNIKTYRKRGMDTNLYILKKLKKQMEFCLRNDIIYSRNKRPQSTLKGKERKENIKGVFYIKENNLPEKVVLFDDVVTTGSTLSECAKLLKKNGVREIESISLARVV